MTSATSCSREELDNTSTGMPLVAASALSARRTSMPGRRGMSRSRRIRSGVSLRARRSPSSPSIAGTTVKPRCRRLASQARRRKRSSSTSRIFLVLAAITPPRCWKCEHERGPATFFGIAPDPAAELFHDESDEVEPEAGPLGLHRKHVVRAIELFEQPALGLPRDPDAVVLDLPAHAVADVTDADGDVARSRRVLDRIRSEVQDDLAQELGVGDHRRRALDARHRDPMAVRPNEARDLLEYAGGQRAEIGGLGTNLQPPALES